MIDLQLSVVAISALPTRSHMIDLQLSVVASAALSTRSHMIDLPCLSHDLLQLTNHRRHTFPVSTLLVSPSTINVQVSSGLITSRSTHNQYVSSGLITSQSTYNRYVVSHGLSTGQTTHNQYVGVTRFNYYIGKQNADISTHSAPACLPAYNVRRVH